MVDSKSQIKDREELLFLLSEAAEFEHAVMCSYLFAAMSLKRSVDETLTAEELLIVTRWRRLIISVAVEEMLHLALVNNLITAFGGSGHLGRPNFPVPAGRFPAGLQLDLSAFSESTLQHFQFLEKPEGLSIPDGTAYRHVRHYHRSLRTDLFSPTPTDYTSQGQLYHTIANGIDALADKLGVDALFSSPKDAQVGAAQFPLPGIFPVTDLASAHRAIEEIVLQGEGAPEHSDVSHYAKFKQIAEDYKAMKQARPQFEPAYQAASNPVVTSFTPHIAMSKVTHPVALKVVDLGNCIYLMMVRSLAQMFSPGTTNKSLRTAFAQVSTSLMYALTTVGEAACKLPIGSDQNGLRAGLSFELPTTVGTFGRNAAAQVLSERASELALVAKSLEAEVMIPGVVDALNSAASKLQKLHLDLEMIDESALQSPAQQATALHIRAAGAASLQADPSNPNQAATDHISINFDFKKCIHSRNCVLDAPKVFIGNVKGPWLHPEEVSAEEMGSIARNCPSGAITYNRLDGGPQESAPDVNVLRVRENGPYAIHADIELGDERLFRGTFCRCGKSKNKPFCDSSHLEVGFIATGERSLIESDPLEVRNGVLNIDPTLNGPLVVTGNLEICGGTGHTIQRVETARLCRCGGSANKPFCDNTHARIGFRSDV